VHADHLVDIPFPKLFGINWCPQAEPASGEPYGRVRVREEKGLRPGGFGLLLMRQIVDELLYNEACNEVLFVKYTD
jgi:hypothetical protein